MIDTFYCDVLSLGLLWVGVDGTRILHDTTLYRKKMRH